MPYVHNDLPATTADADALALADCVHQALVDTFEVPAADRFQVIARHAPGSLIVTPEYLGVRHSAHVALVQIVVSFGRPVEKKRALYARIAADAARQTGFAAADVIIHLVETARENWSFGEGVAHYAPAAS